jgi:hypothetical protein
MKKRGWKLDGVLLKEFSAPPRDRVRPGKGLATPRA